jgi:hypothetical protein
MGLLGKGVLAIWNGIAPEAEEDFVAWHVREHIPERVALSGFLRGRRYVALDGFLKHFNFYETTTADDLSSAAYRVRLDAPTDWTRKVVAQFRDTSRTICDVVLSFGTGDGGTVETLRLSAALRSQTFAARMGRLMPNCSRRRALSPRTCCKVARTRAAVPRPRRYCAVSRIKSPTGFF